MCFYVIIPKSVFFISLFHLRKIVLFVEKRIYAWSEEGTQIAEEPLSEKNGIYITIYADMMLKQTLQEIWKTFFLSSHCKLKNMWFL